MYLCCCKCTKSFFPSNYIGATSLKEFDFTMDTNPCWPIERSDIKSCDCSGVASRFSKKLYNLMFRSWSMNMPCETIFVNHAFNVFFSNPASCCNFVNGLGILPCYSNLIL